MKWNSWGGVGFFFWFFLLLLLTSGVFWFGGVEECRGVMDNFGYSA